MKSYIILTVAIYLKYPVAQKSWEFDIKRVLSIMNI